MIHKLFQTAVLTVALLSTAHSYAETVYIIDNIRVGLRVTANADADKSIVMDSGTKLEVLGQQNGYHKVKTEDGDEGYVSPAYVQSEPTAALQLEQMKIELQEKMAAHQLELQQLNEQNEQVQELNIKLEGILSQLREDNHNLTLEMDDIKSRGIFTSEYRLPVIFITLILFIFVGFVGGYSYYHNKVIKRFGGLEI